MTKRAAAPTDADAALERVRALCFRFPGTEEKISHGAPSFFAGKMFLTFVDNHHADGRLAVWVKSSHEEQQRLVADDGERFFVPPYVGVSGWVGARIDRPDTDWIELAILVEAGWASVVSKAAAKAPIRSPPKTPPRPKTDPAIASAARNKLEAICAALPDSDEERESQHATFRVRKKVYAYFLDNHHGDGIVSVCVKMEKGRNAALVKKEPARFHLPAYIHARGWVGVRLDRGRVDWKDVAARVTESYRAVAPKALADAVRAPAGRAR